MKWNEEKWLQVYSHGKYYITHNKLGGNQEGGCFKAISRHAAGLREWGNKTLRI
jgi:hypothetical protein